MARYTIPIRTAFAFFLPVAVLLTVPYLLWVYHKYGRVSILRSLIIFSFFLYLMCAFALVTLPLPSREWLSRMRPVEHNFQPFLFVREFLSETGFEPLRPETYLPALKKPEFYQPAFNLLLLLPFGVYLSYYFKRSLAQTVLLTFLLSLFIELSQLTGLFGLYPVAFRRFDVDDLMLNTAGGLIGYVVGAHIATRVLPTRSELDAGCLRKSDHVGYLRRLLATLVDVVLVYLIAPEGGVALTCVFFLYFVLLQGLLHGRTPGKVIVRIRTATENTAMPLAACLAIKYALLYVLALALWQYPITFIPIAFFVLADMLHALRSRQRLWYEHLSHTRNISYLRHLRERPRE